MTPQQTTNELLGLKVKDFDNRTTEEIHEQRESSLRWQQQELERIIEKSKQRFPKRFLPNTDTKR